MSARAKGAKSAPASRPTRPKRAAPSVDTRLGSYDRRDPFRAYNVLSSLVGSLSTRPGGSQYKLTADEHTLSLHLLDLIEPFVSAVPARRTLITQQPTEILDAIVYYIDAKQDLLNFAISCKRMHSVIIARHFDYRWIRCRVSSIRVWNHLVVNRDLAKNVRRLEIMDERSTLAEVVPNSIMTTDTDLDSTDDELVGLDTKQERFLVAALTKMTSLSTFIWSCNHSLMRIDNVWPTLLKCRSLSDVQIKDNMIFSDCESASEDKKAVVLPSLRNASFQSTKHKFGATQNPNLSRVKNILNHCPNLENLDIAYLRPPASHGSLPADDLFLFGRWKQLTSLTVTNLRCLPGGGLDAASTFLFAHPNLEILHLDISGMSSSTRLNLAENTLPRLREIQAPRDVVTDILTAATDAPRPLETIKGIRLSGSLAIDQAFLTALKLFGTGVKRMEMNGWHDMEDIRRIVDAAPRVSWFDAGKKLTGGPAAIQTTANNPVEWANVLSALPDLATFHGVKFFYEASQNVSAQATAGQADRSKVRRNDEVASLLAWKCTKLRRVDHWEDNASKVIVLLREKDGGVKWEARRVKASGKN
ncbi:hypothetical protein CYLTODRAFT_364451 [Cylindrobasidium torrendii FP15055 ss-10]|uniref:F-box domain-containing protein n=1 Tax=Cylindrobasidium torrendii FP15055 ss-10 TaxID=1314674 RepID=A0A0D7BV29_9AGAR|nr:hypothetical protein CYLTODRAFT_364451 [Cylindrobasidium torrendii FP15055 ss-10]